MLNDRVGGKTRPVSPRAPSHRPQSPRVTKKANAWSIPNELCNEGRVDKSPSHPRVSCSPSTSWDAVML